MRALLKFDFRRLFKSKTFWLVLIFTIFSTVMDVVTIGDADIKYLDEIIGDQFSFFIFIIGIFVPIFALGDFKGGMIRNKLSQGYSRTEVFISNLIVTVFASIIFAVAWLASFYPIAIARYGVACPPEDFEPVYRFWFVVASLLYFVAYASFCHLLSMLISNRAAVISIIVFGALCLVTFIIPGFVIMGFSEPTITEEVILSEDENSVVVEYREVENTSYLEENNPIKIMAKAICVMVIPSQFILISGFVYPITYCIILYDIVIAVVIAGLGLLLFKRKEIK